MGIFYYLYPMDIKVGDKLLCKNTGYMKNGRPFAIKDHIYEVQTVGTTWVKIKTEIHPYHQFSIKGDLLQKTFVVKNNFFFPTIHKFNFQ
jgi:hypothetical protein